MKISKTQGFIGTGLLLLAGAITWYIIANIDNDELKDENGNDDDTKAPDAPSTPMLKPLASVPKTPFINAAEGNAFRGWVNDKDAAYAKSISLDRTGAYDNSYIRKAYSKYGIEYEKYKAGQKQQSNLQSWIGQQFFANKRDVSVYTYPKASPEFIIKTFKLSDVTTHPIGRFMGVSAEPGWYKASIVFRNKAGGFDRTPVYIPADQISRTTV